MALFVAFFPGSLTTNAVWYGCDLSKRKFHGDLITDSELICSQLENFDWYRASFTQKLPSLFHNQRQIRINHKKSKSLLCFCGRISVS